LSCNEKVIGHKREVLLIKHERFSCRNIFVFILSTLKLQERQSYKVARTGLQEINIRKIVLFQDLSLSLNTILYFKVETDRYRFFEYRPTLKWSSIGRSQLNRPEPMLKQKLAGLVKKMLKTASCDWEKIQTLL